MRLRPGLIVGSDAYFTSGALREGSILVDSSADGIAPVVVQSLEDHAGVIDHSQLPFDCAQEFANLRSLSIDNVVALLSR